MEEIKNYYHGLAGGIPFWHERKVLNSSIETLEKILMLGGIYCRRELEQRKIIYSDKEAVYNGKDYISICIENPSDDEFQGENSNLDSSFFRYVKTKIGLELSKDILTTCKFRLEPYKRLPGERQVLHFIDKSNITRVIIGLSNSIEKEAIEKIERICNPYHIPVTTFKEQEYQKRKSMNQ